MTDKNKNDVMSIEVENQIKAIATKAVEQAIKELNIDVSKVKAPAVDTSEKKANPEISPEEVTVKEEAKGSDNINGWIPCIPDSNFRVPEGATLEVFESKAFEYKMTDKVREDTELGLELLQVQINKNAADRKAGKPAHIFEEALRAVGF